MKSFGIYLSTLLFIGFLFFLSACDKDIELPEVSTGEISEITIESAKSGGNVTDDGGGEITARGVVWNTSENPTVDNNAGKTTDGTGIGSFTSDITGLNPATVYYVRAYATNSEGTSYGSQRNFTTVDPESLLATVTTAEVSEITTGTAKSGGNVIADGGYAVTARGVVWSENENPTVDDHDGKTTDGDGLGEFESTLDGLTNGKTYYLRAYATNSMGTAYGDQKEFTTELGLAIVETHAVTGIKVITATGGGSVSNQGISAVTARGVVWSTSAEPTTESNEGITSNGSGTGNFVSSIEGLTSATKYYVRAYATNSAGTAYGSQVEFTTFNGGTVQDIEDNTYQTVIIGTQEWMMENLKTQKYNNGDDIITGLDNLNWQMTDAGAFSVYPHSDVAGIGSNQEMIDAYGILYNWYAVNDDRGICPTGWRVPSDNDFATLIEFLDTNADASVVGEESEIAGGLLKSTSTHPGAHPKWNAPNTGATNQFGFYGYPAGWRQHDGYFFLGTYGVWWTSSPDNTNAWTRSLSNEDASTYRYNLPKFYGFSVRCVK